MKIVDLSVTTSVANNRNGLWMESSMRMNLMNASFRCRYTQVSQNIYNLNSKLCFGTYHGDVYRTELMYRPAWAYAD